jgi:hypothetical protein
MNLQRLIEQHPAAPAAIMPILFVCLWLFVSATISVIGGWFSLAKVYRAQGAFDGTKWTGQSGGMRRLANYNRVLTIGVDPQGWESCSRRLLCSKDDTTEGNHTPVESLVIQNFCSPCFAP